MVLSVLLALWACGGDPPPAPAPDAEPVVAPAPTEAALPTTTPPARWAVKDKMHEQFAFATDAVYHTIRGDLDAAKAEATKLAALEAPDEGWPEGWGPHILTLKTAATRMTRATDLDAAAAGSVAIGQACAACHSQTDGPELTVAEAVGSPWPTNRAMDRHSWAAYLMWLGVIAPSGDLFAAGVDQLAHPDGPLPEVPESVEALEEKVHAIALAAAEDPSEARQAEAFATFLQTCAACHTQLKIELP